MKILSLAINGEYEVFRALVEEDDSFLYSECNENDDATINYQQKNTAHQQTIGKSE